MASSRQFAFVTLAPGFIVGAGAFGYAAVSAYLLGNCDSKLGCSGGVWLGAFMGGAAFALSTIGLVIGCYVHRTALRTFRATHLAGAVVLLSALTTVLLLTVPYWTYSVLGSVLAWVLAATIAGWAVVGAIRRLAPNNSFNPMPLRGTG
jgi:hypothetical protein